MIEMIINPFTRLRKIYFVLLALFRPLFRLSNKGKIARMQSDIHRNWHTFHVHHTFLWISRSHLGHLAIQLHVNLTKLLTSEAPLCRVSNFVNPNVSMYV